MSNMFITVMYIEMICNLFRSLRDYHQGVCTPTTCVYNNI